MAGESNGEIIDENRNHSYLAQPCSDYVQTAVRTVTQIHMHEAAGDVLVFMTGQVCARARAAQAHRHSHDAAGRHRRRRPPKFRLLHDAAPPQPLWPLPHRHSHLRRDAAPLSIVGGFWSRFPISSVHG